MNRPHILFDIIPEDWEDISAEIINERVIKQLHPGGIILLHDAIGEGENSEASRLNTLRAVEMMIENIQGQGYRFVTIGELIALEGK